MLLQFGSHKHSQGGVPTCVQAALDLLADLMTSSRECLREGLVLLVRLTFALEPQQEFKWRAQPEAIIRWAPLSIAPPYQ